VKLELDDTREALTMKKAGAELEFVRLAMEYETLWVSLQPNPGLQELERIKSSQLARLSQPLGIAGGPPNVQAYLDVLLTSTRTLMPKFERLLAKLAQATGVRVICAPVKPVNRVHEKALFYYEGDRSKVLDLGRGSAIADDINMVVRAAQWIITNCSVVRLKNRFCDARSHRGGYRDMLINIHLGGLIFEVQIHLKVFHAMRAQHSRSIEMARQALEPTLFKLAMLDRQQAEDARRERTQVLLGSRMSISPPPSPPSFSSAGSISTSSISSTCSMSSSSISSTYSMETDLSCKRKSASTARIIAACSYGLQNLHPQPTAHEWQEFVNYARDDLRVECLYGLGYCLKYGRGTRKNAQEAVDFLRVTAERKYAPGQDSLGGCYEHGIGVRTEANEAVRLYRLAVEQNYAGAQLSLGHCYEIGVGVFANPAEAVRLYQLAADQDHPIAQFRLGMCLEKGVGAAKDEEMAVAWYQRAANQKYAEAQYHLARCLELGVGAAVNKREAFQYYRLAAEQFHPGGQCSIGVCYERGIGVVPDAAEAVKWYRLAVAQNCAQALYYLGCCYRDGVAVPKSEQEANRLFQLVTSTQREGAMNMSSSVSSP